MGRPWGSTSFTLTLTAGGKAMKKLSSSYSTAFLPPTACRFHRSVRKHLQGNAPSHYSGLQIYTLQFTWFIDKCIHSLCGCENLDELWTLFWIYLACSCRCRFVYDDMDNYSDVHPMVYLAQVDCFAG
jgi:hypothetical protein